MQTLTLLLVLAAQADPAGVEFFEKRIRPVLVERCYGCHSAGAEKIKGGLTLDTRAGVQRGGENGPVVVPGDPATSRLIRAIKYDGDLKMPPKGRLTARQVQDLEAWVKRGAPDPRDGAAAPLPKKKGIDLEEGRKHWAFQPLRRPAPPRVKDEAWCRTDVDRFILSRLERKGLTPNTGVDRRRLIRRASLDLIGLPPTPEEVDRFVGDPEPDAYGKLIDRLLESPRYGERWGRHWLDVARFAESHGFEQDYDRKFAYHYRDFVIQALNRDMPFDRFVRWQIAGDELAPDEPLAWMATGFLGAGVFPTQLTEVEFEPARYDELDNMVSTLSNAFLGLSVGCARCHDHKYDPIPTEDYYRMAATFTRTIRSEIDMELAPDGLKPDLARWEKEHAPLADALGRYEEKELPARFREWAAAHPDGGTEKPAWSHLELVDTKSHGGATFRKLDDGSLLVTGKNPKNDRWTFTARTRETGITAVRLEALAHPSLKHGGPGRASNGNFALSIFRVTARPLRGGTPKPVKLVAARATFEQNATSLSVAGCIDDDRVSGWAVDPQFGRDHAAVFEFDGPVGFEGGTELTFSFEFNNNVRHAIGRPRLSLSTLPRPVPLEGEAVPPEVRKAIAAGRPGPRALAWYRSRDEGWRKLRKAVDDDLARKPAVKPVKVMVTTEGYKPIKHHADGRGFPHFYKETYFLARGDTTKKKGVATQGFLRVLERTPEQEKHWQVEPPAGSRTPMLRTAMARWLTDTKAGAGPLAARVIVNRLWHHHLGRGLVATPNDFGTQAPPPSHPELLEWLAADLVQGGWRLKRLHKLIMTSAVYRMSTASDPGCVKVDPENGLLWRRPLHRLEGEAIRDSMLFVGGLLDTQMFGPGTLNEASNRRSVYFFIKRSKLIPSMQLFDQPEALVSVGSRASTTIAPQALMFMNSPHVRRYAEAFAKRAGSVEGAYRIAFGRKPTEAEGRSAAAFLERQRASYAGEGKKDAAGLALADFCQALLSSSEFIYVD